MAALVKILVAGALGRMGREVVAGVSQDPELELVGGVDPRATEEHLDPPQGEPVPLGIDLVTMIERTRPTVMVDFTTPEAALDNARAALRHRVSPVVGTTGLKQADLDIIARLAEEQGVGALVAPNFAIGANLLVHFARIAARYLPNAEIVELHHDQKADAPSGTALSTARAMRESRSQELEDAPTRTFTLDGVRGGVEGGVRIHSVRLPGLVAHQEVIFGGPGQTLTIRHDSITRESFIPGVLIAVKAVSHTRGLVYGLDTIMGLGEV